MIAEEQADKPWRHMSANQIELNSADISGWLFELTSCVALLGTAVTRLSTGNGRTVNPEISELTENLKKIGEGIEIIAKRTYDKRSHGNINDG